MAEHASLQAFWSTHRRRVLWLVLGVLFVSSSVLWSGRHLITQRRVRLAVEAAGGSCKYEWMGDTRRGIARESVPRRWHWLSRTIGPEFFGQIIAVNLNNGVNRPLGRPLIESLGSLSALRSLDLGGCTDVTDTDLVILRQFPSLGDLTLSGTAVRGSGLAHLAGSQKLSLLKLNRTPLNDAGLALLPPLKSLRHVDLDSTRITGAGLTSLARVNSLVSLSLSNSQVDSIEQLATLPRLESLMLNRAPITDAAIEALSSFPALQSLDLEGCPIGNRGLVALAASPVLSSLRLRGTQITDRGLEQFADKFLKVHQPSVSKRLLLQIQSTRVSQSTIDTFNSRSPNLEAYAGPL